MGAAAFIVAPTIQKSGFYLIENEILTAAIETTALNENLTPTAQGLA